jgi:isoleucyl-tRNA synthetase
MGLLSRLPAEPLRLINFHLACSSSQRFLSTSIPRTLDKKAYSHTLRLPKTDVPTRHKNPVAVEEKLRASLSDELYRWQVCSVPFSFTT